MKINRKSYLCKFIRDYILYNRGVNYFRFSIDNRNIFSLTTDNARNVTEIGVLISNEKIKEKVLCSEYVDIVDEKTFEILNKIRNKIFLITKQVSCACNIIELVLKDGLAEYKIQTLINKENDIVKILRFPIIMQVRVKKQIFKIRLDGIQFITVWKVYLI